MTIRLLPVLALSLLLAGCTPPGGAPRSAADSEKAAAAQNAADNGNFEEAVASYNALIAASPRVMENYLELAILYRKMEQPAQAVATMQKAREKEPKSARVLTHLGYAYMDNGQPQQAADAFAEAITIIPNNPSAHNGRAIALDNLGDNRGAQAAYRAALALSPPNQADIENNLAMSLILSGDYPAAVALLEPLAKGEESNETIRQNLALAYGMKGDTKKAMAMNLKDLTQAQAKQNMRFYEQYRKQLKKPGKAAPAAKKKAASTPVAPLSPQEVIDTLAPEETAAPATAATPAVIPVTGTALQTRGASEDSSDAPSKRR